MKRIVRLKSSSQCVWPTSPNTYITVIIMKTVGWFIIADVNLLTLNALAVLKQQFSTKLWARPDQSKPSADSIQVICKNENVEIKEILSRWWHWKTEAVICLPRCEPADQHILVYFHCTQSLPDSCSRSLQKSVWMSDALWLWKNKQLLTTFRAVTHYWYLKQGESIKENFIFLRKLDMNWTKSFVTGPQFFTLLLSSLRSFNSPPSEGTLPMSMNTHSTFHTVFIRTSLLHCVSDKAETGLKIEIFHATLKPAEKGFLSATLRNYKY